MTENQTKFVELAKRYEQAKEALNQLGLELAASLNLLEINSYFQDETTNIVYKIVKPKGTFVAYKDVDYVRTALEGERQGSLSKKEANEKGFFV